MRLRDPRILLGAVSLGFVLTLFYHDLERTSPGTVSRTHGRDPELAQGGNCSACHGALGQDLSEACQVCHDAIHEQLADRRGFHGTLASELASDCGHCHLEHHGPDFSLVGPLAFREAGFAQRDEYEHQALGFSLRGRHLELDCAACHALADVEVLEKGSTRFIGLDQDCATCHEDPHGGRMARACDACHGQAHAFTDLAAFSHTIDFALVGGHAGLACTDCHAPLSPHAVESLAGSNPLPPARSCSACHDDPHRPEFLSALAASPRADGLRESCELCHDAAHQSFEDHGSFDRELHALSGFPLSGPHDLECASCHAARPGRKGFEQRFPGRSENDCAACHDDPHEGTMGSTCIECHALPHPFEGVAGFEHGTFELSGAHAELACAACHDPGTPYGIEALSGPGPAPRPRVCLDCHRSPHSASFEAGTARALRIAVPTTCAQCHDPATSASFDQVSRPLSAQLHAEIGFSLGEPHARIACVECHGASDLPFELRFPGRSEEECAACHADVHGGQFDDWMLAGEGCVSCHDRRRFVPPSFGVDEHSRASFLLQGSHRAVACSACHRLADGTRGARLFAGTPSRCEDCHADAHRGAFDRPELTVANEDGEGCARCHTTTLFSEAGARRFDHGFWTGYSLEGPHGEVDCERCHPVSRERDATGRRFGFALGHECSDCHADPHAGQFAVSGSTACGRCHLDSVPFAQVSFDHDVDSRFPLDEQHRDLACAACHRPWPLPGGGEAVRYRPLGMLCGDCHSASGREGKGR